MLFRSAMECNTGYPARTKPSSHPAFIQLYSPHTSILPSPSHPVFTQSYHPHPALQLSSRHPDPPQSLTSCLPTFFCKKPLTENLISLICAEKIPALQFHWGKSTSFRCYTNQSTLTSIRCEQARWPRRPGSVLIGLFL